MPSRWLGNKSIKTKAWCWHDSRPPTPLKLSSTSHLQHISFHMHFHPTLAFRSPLVAVSISRPVKLSVPFCADRPLVHYVPIYTQTYHASPCNTSSPLCHSRCLRCWTVIAWLLCIRSSLLYSVCCIYHYLWSPARMGGLVLVVLIENVSISPTLIYLRDKLSLPPLHNLPNLELHIPTHMRETMTGIYASHRSEHPHVSLLCRFQPIFPVSITCSFPAILVLLVSSLQRVFLSPFSPTCIRDTRMYAYLPNNNVYTSPLSAFCLGFIY
jgi:hypothetical protein